MGEDLSSTDLDYDGQELGNINFVDVSVAQLAKASIISWATRISAGPGVPNFLDNYVSCEQIVEKKLLVPNLYF